MTDRTLSIVTCGAPLASRVGDGVREARSRGWDPYVIPTHAALAWLEGQDPAALRSSRATGSRGSRSAPQGGCRGRRTPDLQLPQRLGRRQREYIPADHPVCSARSRTPTVAVPFAKHDLAGHPARLASLAVVRYAGVNLVDPHDGSTASVKPLESGSGKNVAAGLQWSWVLAIIE